MTAAARGGRRGSDEKLTAAVLGAMLMLATGRGASPQPHARPIRHWRSVSAVGGYVADI
jgi:hypothetical protein